MKPYMIHVQTSNKIENQNEQEKCCPTLSIYITFPGLYDDIKNLTVLGHH